MGEHHDRRPHEQRASPCLDRQQEALQGWHEYLYLLLDVVMPRSEGLLDAELGQLAVNDTLVIQLHDVLLSQVAAVVRVALLIYINFFLPPLLISCNMYTRLCQDMQQAHSMQNKSTAMVRRETAGFMVCVACAGI